MTIRNRLTLWYAGILLASLALLATAVYYEWIEQYERLLHTPFPEPAWEEVAEVMLFYGLPTSLLLLFAGWLFLRHLLAPITALTQAAERIQMDHLTERPRRTGNGDELDRLTDVFNAMTTRLENSFSRVREFTLHASHELKTPLTVMRAEIESALRRGDGDAGHREILIHQLDEIQRLTKIVDGLTFLAKSDAGQMALNYESFRLDNLVKDSFADAQILAQPRGIEVSLTECDEVTVRGDRHRFRQLLLNLTDNAVKYSRSNGFVTFALRGKSNAAELSITNTGDALTPEKLSHVFEPFYRGDPAHNNEVEGCGLGLSIAQRIVQMHGGSIAMACEASSSIRVTVRLPL